MMAVNEGMDRFGQIQLSLAAKAWNRSTPGFDFIARKQWSPRFLAEINLENAKNL